MEGLEVTKEFESTPLTAPLIDAYQKGVLKMSAALVSGERSPETLAAHFSKGLNGSSENSIRESLSVSPEKPRHEPKSLPGPKLKRGRGRPKGAKNRPKEERAGHPPQESPTNQNDE